MTNYTRKAIGGALISSIFLGLTTVVALLIRIVLARNLSVEDFGLFYAVLAFVVMFTFLRDLALSEAQVWFIPRFIHRKALGRIKGLVYLVLSVQTVLGTLFFLSVIIAAPALAQYYFKSPVAIDILMLMGLWVLLYGIFETISLAFNATMNIFYQTSMRFLHLFMVLSLSVFLLSKGLGVRAVAFAYPLSTGLICVIYFTLLRTKVFPWFSTTKIRLTFNHIKEYLRYSLPLLPATAAIDFLFSNMTLALLTLFGNLTQVALYAVALSASKLLRHVYEPVKNVLFPLSSELWEKGKVRRLSKGVGMLYKYVLILTIPIAGTLMAFPKELIGAFFGQNYVGASLVLQIIAPTMIIITYARIVESLFMGIGKTLLATKQVYVGGALNLVLGLILIPRFGMVGAAVTLFIASLGRVVYGMNKLEEFVAVEVPVIV